MHRTENNGRAYALSFFFLSIENGTDKDVALKAAVKKIDQAAAKNSAARKKSALTLRQMHNFYAQD